MEDELRIENGEWRIRGRRTGERAGTEPRPYGVTEGAANGAAGCGHPALRRGRGMRIAASACGLLAMTIIFCHSEERNDVGIRSFVGGLVGAGVSGRPHRAAPTQY